MKEPVVFGPIIDLAFSVYWFAAALTGFLNILFSVFEVAAAEIFSCLRCLFFWTNLGVATFQAVMITKQLFAYVLRLDQVWEKALIEVVDFIAEHLIIWRYAQNMPKIGARYAKTWTSTSIAVSQSV